MWSAGAMPGFEVWTERARGFAGLAEGGIGRLETGREGE